MNRVYNAYLARDFREMVSGPMIQIVLCKEHWKRYKLLLKKDSGTYAFKGPKTEVPCF